VNVKTADRAIGREWSAARALSARTVRLSPLARYAIAIAAGIVAILLRLAFDPVWGIKLPYITLFPAIMISAWLGGLWPGVVTTLITGIAAEYFWIEPAGSWAVAEKSELLGVAVFLVIGAVISVLNEGWRRGIGALAESEERLSVTLGSIGDAVIATDEQGRVIRLNAIAERLTGWTQDEAAGQPLESVFVIINELSRQPVENPAGRVLRQGAIAGLANHTVLVARDGRETPIDDSAAPIRTADGRLTGVVMVFRDITARRAVDRERTALLDAERAARREAETAAQQLQTALRAGRMGTWKFTMANGRVEWSPGLEAIHGYAPGAFPGTFEAFRDEIHPEDTERVIDAIRTAVEQRCDHRVEYRIVRRDGIVRWVEGLGRVVSDEHGQPAFMIGVCADVTERREIEDQRAQLLDREHAARVEIERASRLKDEFLAVLSHELRTPLNAVLGYAHLLNSGALPPERTGHALDAIQRNAQAQARLVESLLDLSRIMAGKFDLDLQRLDLGRVVEGAVDVIRPEADGRGVVLEVMPPPSPIALMADGGRLQQVLWNLLSNAVKFTPRDGRVTVGWRQQDSTVRIEVRDTGQGIRADFLPHVFDRFSQADSQMRGARAGLGLGLALVREMVTAHGGTVTAESPGDGQGSTFVVTLPALPAEAGAKPAFPVAAAAGSAPPLPRLDILVVDDDGDVREVLALLLEAKGAVVRTASSAAEAFAAIRRRRPNLLLADLRMPGENGYSLIRKLRSEERTRHHAPLAAIAVSATDSQRDREEALVAGYDWHVAKPVTPDDLAHAIARVVSAHPI
jgi:PAS domain S-box-containing protein